MPLGLNIAKLVSESHLNPVTVDCFNDPFVPDDASSKEQSFHAFLDDQEMKELNVQRYLDNKNRHESTKVQQALIERMNSKSAFTVKS